MRDNKLWIYKKPENEADGMPTAIQELVLCKYCKHGEEVPMFKYYPDVTWCNKYSTSHNDDWFCADGRRVDNDA